MTADTTKPKKTRNRKTKHFIATIAGDEAPIVIIAKNFKDALAAVVKITEASASELIAAGKAGYTVLDTTDATAKEPAETESAF